MFSKALIVYFSGTGGTERVADEFDKQLKSRLCETNKYPLDLSLSKEGRLECQELIEKSDLVILAFAVHAVDAPDPVYYWIQNIQGMGKKAVVVSVSGGGEVWPNTGCRSNCISALERKGFEVIYEKMLVMPCNWVFSISDDLAVRLLQILPKKINKILDETFSGHRRRNNYKKGLFATKLTKGEKGGAYKFSKKIKINEKCSGCGWCASNCPVKNINIKDGKPHFEEKCIICFRCIYGCPRKAMESKNFMVLKEGFDIKAAERRMEGKELLPVEQCIKGIKGLFFKALKAYLLDKEK
ncbi:MAG TPA: EFR1 family ferrodoxin [Clostridia bacterium]|nr:EFR1 family ferrodoxin [Clostridia bacterium]